MFRLVLSTFFFLTAGIVCNAWAADASVSKDIDAGRGLYLQYGCAICHGKEGYGDGPVAKRLYAMPTNFHVPASYLVSPEGLVMKNIIIRGYKNDNSVMPAFDHIPDQELNQIVDFLLSLQNHENKK